MLAMIAIIKKLQVIFETIIWSFKNSNDFISFEKCWIVLNEVLIYRTLKD